MCDVEEEIENAVGNTAIGTITEEIGTNIYDAQKDPVSDAYDDLTGKDEEKALKEQIAQQEAAQLAQLEFMKEQYGDITEGLRPYREAGETFLPKLQEMLSPEARQSFISDYLQGSEYQQLQDQATQQLLQSSAATGNLGASGTQDRLARQTLQMGSQLGGNAYNQALGNLTTGTNLGLGTFGTQLQAQGQLNQGMQQGLGNLAQLGIGRASIGQGGLMADLAPFIQTGAAIYGAS